MLIVLIKIDILLENTLTQTNRTTKVRRNERATWCVHRNHPEKQIIIIIVYMIRMFVEGIE